MTPMVNTGLLSQAPYSSVGASPPPSGSSLINQMLSQIQPQPTQTAPPSRLGSSLLNTGANYSYPITSGLLGALAPGATDYTAQALSLAGNPHAGPYAAVPIPSGSAIPGAGTGSSSSGSNTGAAALGLLGVLAKNPSLVKNVGSSISGLLGPSGPSASAGPANAAANPSVYEPSDPAATQSLDPGGDIGADVGAGSGGLTALTDADIAASDAATGGALTGADIGAGATDSALSAGSGGASLPAALGPLSDIYGIYSGLQQGGGIGQMNAALDSYQLYNAAQAAGLLGSAPAAGTGASAASAGAGATSSLAAMGPGLIFGAGMYGLGRIFDNQGANPLSVSNAFKQVAAGTPNLPLGYTANTPAMRGVLQNAGQDYAGLAQQILAGNYAGAVGGAGTNVSGIPFKNMN